MARGKPLVVFALVVAAAGAAWAVTAALARRAGQLGLGYHANLQSAEAERAYAAAERLAWDPAPWTYYRALLQIERGDHEAAAAGLRQVTRANPQHAFAWFHLGEIALKAGRTDEAQDAYARVLALPPVASFSLPDGSLRQAVPLRVYAEFGLARLADERGAFDEAARRLEQLVTAQPRFAPARTLLQQLRAAEGRHADMPERRARTSAYVPPADPLIDALVAASNNTDLLLKHAAIATRSADVAWRTYLAERALTLSPNALDVLLEMASLSQDDGDHAGALEYLRQAAVVAPDDHHTLVQMGRSLAELDRLNEAEAVLRRAARVRDASAEYNLATVLDRQQRWEEARQHYERALVINPFHVRAMNNLAIGLAERGESALALRLYDRALRTAPDDAAVRSNLGSTLISQRRYAEAIRALEAAILLDPDAADAYNNLGIALAFSGRLAEARLQFREALQRAPDHADARRNLARVTNPQ